MRCPNCRLENPPSAVKCDCGYNFETSRKEAPIYVSANDGTASATGNSKNEWVRFVGGALIIVGLALAGYFTFLYDTSLQVPSSAVSSDKSDPAIRPDRVNNIGLLQNRQSGISGGLELSILGALILLYGKDT